MKAKTRNAYTLNRGDFLKAGGAGLVAVSLAGCDLLSTSPATKSGSRSRGSGANNKGREAPMLAERVKAGELPPVEERLPRDPLVVEPIERVGVYEGTWNNAILGASDTVTIFMYTAYEHLMSWDPGWTKVTPNVARSVEVNESGTEYTFRLREGMRWSDGEPFSADDIIFAVNDVFFNEELFAEGPPGIVTVNGRHAEVEKLHDYAVRFTFPEPKGLFLEDIATANGQYLTSIPRHYFERFHKKYNPAVERLLKEEQAPDWVELFLSKGGGSWSFGQNPDLPSLYGWRLVNPVGEGNRAVYERNPYYFKVDPEGSQLPYLDTVVYSIVQDPEVMLLRVLNGQIDMSCRHFSNLSNKPVVVQNRDKGDYRLFDTTYTYGNTTIICLNLCHKNAALREVFNNKDFRVGLSHAINRQEIVDTFFVSQGEPWQGAPGPDSPFHSETLAKQYTEYDVDRANMLLDRAGYRERNEEGTRLGPDGEPIRFQIETSESGEGFDWVGILEMISDRWREVGVEMRPKYEERSLFYERKAANEHDANVWTGAESIYFDTLLDPRWYFPFSGESNFAIPWATWYESRGKAGQEPPEAAKRQMELYDRVKAAADKPERDELMRRLLQIAQREFWVMGLNLLPEGYGIVKNNFHNVPDRIPYSWQYPTPAPTGPEQFFIEG